METYVVSFAIWDARGLVTADGGQVDPYVEVTCCDKRWLSEIELGKKLGSGSFADVYAVRHKTRPEERYAIKCSKRKFKSKVERCVFLRVLIFHEGCCG